MKKMKISDKYLQGIDVRQKIVAQLLESVTISGFSRLTNSRQHFAIQGTYNQKLSILFIFPYIQNYIR